MQPSHTGTRTARARVLFIHHRSEPGGAPLSLAYLVRHLDTSRFEAHVYVPPGRTADLLHDAGASVHTGPVAGLTHCWSSSYHGLRWALLGREFSRLPGHLWALRRVLSDGRFDIVHLNDQPMIPAAWLASRAGVPVVWHLRSALAGGGEDRRSELVRCAIRMFSAASIAITLDIAELYRVGSEVIPNAVNLERFCPGDAAAARAALRLRDRPTVLSVGYLYPLKGYEDMIRAAGVLRERGIDATFLLVGGAVRMPVYFRTPVGRALRFAGVLDDHETHARRLVADLGLEDRVHFLPFVGDPAQLYRASDVVVAASRGPELGRSLIEAAACGVASVATGSTTGGGIVVPGVTGLLAETTPSSMAAALEHLLGDADLRGRMARAAVQHARRNFDPRRNARRVEAVYERILSEPAEWAKHPHHAVGVEAHG